MTNLQALQSTVSYPVSDNTFNRLLLDRGLNPADAYSGKSQAFDLAKADLYKELVASANISEGGFTVSISEKAQLKDLANEIYGQYNEPLIAAPTVKGVSPW